MTTLVINDLLESKDLDRNAMATVYGGMPESFLAILDNDVTNVTKFFGFSQANLATLVNNQTIIGGNGIVFAPVFQDNDQDNTIAAG